MFNNFLTIALRNIFRNKIYAFINIFGLTVGISGFLIMFLYVQNEFRYDRFHKNIDEIYLVYRLAQTADGLEKSASTPDPLPSWLKNNYSGWS